MTIAIDQLSDSDLISMVRANLRAALSERGLSTASIMQNGSLAPSDLNHVLDDTKDINAAHLLRLAVLLSLSLDELLAANETMIRKRIDFILGPNDHALGKLAAFVTKDGLKRGEFS